MADRHRRPGGGVFPRRGYDDNPDNDRRQRNERIRQRPWKTRLGYRRLIELKEKEPSDILMTIATADSGLQEALNDTTVEGDMVVLLLHCISKACKTRSLQSQLIRVLSLLEGSLFFQSTVTRYLLEITSNPGHRHKQPLSDVIFLLKEFATRMPNSVTSVFGLHAVLDSVINVVRATTDIVDDEMWQDFNVCTDIKESMLKKSERKKNRVEREAEKIEDTAPPDNFRDLAVFPQTADIQRDEAPYLRRNRKKGGYNDLEHYLDVQFRLLREDFLAPLRDGIKEYIDTSHADGKVKRLQELRIYSDVQIISPICTNSGLCYRLAFDVGKLKRVKWEVSKRLIFGSLLCLSSDNFQTLLFATVVDRDPKKLKEGVVDVKFEHNLEEISELPDDTRFVMAETTAYFEAYRHVLRGLQLMQDGQLPFENYIVYCETNVHAPAYLRRDQNGAIFDLRPLVDEDVILRASRRLGEALGENRDVIEYDFSPRSAVAKSVSILETKEWPSPDRLHVDESQYRAIQSALTKEFVIIQGPPGTGKTYIGLKIVRALLHNHKVWNTNQEDRNDDNRPMLIVCYTNHALDQFLEGIVGFYRGDVVRVGGRSSSEVMKKYNLSSFRQRIRIEREVPGMIHRNRMEARHDMKALQDEINRFANKIELAEREILHEDFLQPYIGSLYADFMSGYERLMSIYSQNYFGPKKKRSSAIVEWLGYGDVLAQVVNQQPDGHPGGGLENANAGVANDDGEEEMLEVEDEVGAMVARRELDEEIEELLGDENLDIDQDEIRSLLERIVLAPNQVALNVSNLDARMLQEHPNDGWQMTKGQKKKMKERLRKELRSTDRMDEEEIETIFDMWDLTPQDKWRLYRYWVNLLVKGLKEQIYAKQQEFEEVTNRYREVLMQEDKEILRKATVIGMTTTGAAKHQSILQEIGPRVIIVEEAAEVLEAHVVTTLSQGCEHLILIGDHKQLKPNPTVYTLAKDFNLDLSLFERMVNNKMSFKCLELQHRMRPDISRMMKIIYPELKDHEVVSSYGDVRGVADNFFFIQHDYPETPDEDLRSHSNRHEAQYVAAFCKYLLLQGYEPEQITILTLYSGQLFELRKIMPKSIYNGVRITVVDNYQGEENDIVVLSLVRSNEDGNIGFLKIDNRVCVALSRAKKGLYVIGNLQLMAAQSKLWNEIVVHAHKNRIFGTGLRLYCQNHPNDDGIFAEMPDDFKKAPEGGCMKTCDYRLPCGHTCAKVCHTNDRDHEEYQCRKPCTKQMCDTRDHRCTRMCYQECGNCEVKVSKRLPNCGHYQDVACYIKPENVRCQARCRRLLDCGHPCTKPCGAECTENCPVEVDKKWSCGHSCRVRCFEKDTISCRHPCRAVLQCEHRCAGTCGDCSGGRLHQVCSAGCGRILICGHNCNDKCSNCPPCRNQCQNRCKHSKCQKICGDTCVPCVEQCDWICAHYRCTRLCHEPCNRPRCNEPCQKVLRCSHPCIGLCGEPCPKKCRVCNRREVTQIFFGNEDEEDARFILLKDCNHIIEVTALDTWMDQASTEGEDKASVQLKVCPLCKTPIRRNLRYGNMIKQALIDIESVKKRILGNSDRIKELERDIPRQIRQLSSRDDAAMRKQLDEVRRTTMSVNALVAIENQIKFLLSLQKLNTGWKDKTGKYKEEQTKALGEISDIRQWVLRERMYFTEQELTDVQNELKRLRMLMNFLMYKGKKDNLGKKLDYITEVDVQRTERLLTDGKSFDADKQGKVKRTLDKLKELIPLSGLGVSEDERLDILKAMNLAKGHWYKCPNGHVYAIGDCGGANQVSTCPDCKATIGGMSHRLREGNQVATEMDGARHAAWSEQANLENYGFNVEFE